TSAKSSRRDGSKTPISCPEMLVQGLLSGPTMLNTVRMPIIFLAAATVFIDGWKEGANRNPMPVFSMHDCTFAGGALKSRPTCSHRSALPQTPDTDLLPCFATLAPAAHATMAAAVLMLNDLIESPPGPQVSMSGPFTSGVILVACLLSARRI